MKLRFGKTSSPWFGSLRRARHNRLKLRAEYNPKFIDRWIIFQGRRNPNYQKELKAYKR